MPDEGYMHVLNNEICVHIILFKIMEILNMLKVHVCV